tara:strand:- start:3991 stop:4485 length:495 start_codon:yes stop_codon:yes gene_type:complete
MPVLKVILIFVAMIMTGCASTSTTVDFSEVRETSVNRVAELRQEGKKIPKIHRGIIQETEKAGKGSVEYKAIDLQDFLVSNKLDKISMDNCETASATVSTESSYTLWVGGNSITTTGENIKNLPKINVVTMVCNYTKNLIVIGKVDNKDYYDEVKVELPTSLKK